MTFADGVHLLTLEARGVLSPPDRIHTQARLTPDNQEQRPSRRRECRKAVSSAPSEFTLANGAPGPCPSTRYHGLASRETCDRVRAALPPGSGGREPRAREEAARRSTTFRDVMLTREGTGGPQSRESPGTQSRSSRSLLAFYLQKQMSTRAQRADFPRSHSWRAQDGVLLSAILCENYWRDGPVTCFLKWLRDLKSETWLLSDQGIYFLSLPPHPQISGFTQWFSSLKLMISKCSPPPTPKACWLGQLDATQHRWDRRRTHGAFRIEVKWNGEQIKAA
ncbi:uncharacterized protein LOC114883882 [Monodon monoceros]|uniref:uncharacterized protein LOC114883882 n=1 Tax=Monodon monoceros TaxID=40151 RepID=UPI0010F6953F|nr:uncharacterized protein LOC114883882 [Monodon monoceros]